MQRLVVEQTRRIFRRLGGHAVYATFYFASGHAITKERAYDLGGQIARELYAQYLPRRVDEQTVQIHTQKFPELLSITIHGSVDGHDELWHPAVAGWVAPVTVRQVQDVIERKSKRLPAIRGRCDTAWLLIANDVFRTSAPCELTEEVRRHPFESPFDRTVWLESPHVYDLGCAATPDPLDG